MLNTFCSTTMVHSVWTDYMARVCHPESMWVMVSLLLADIILLMDCPNRWRNTGDIKKIQHRIV